MRKRTGNLSSISLALAVLMASDAAMVLAAYLPGSGERGLAAQEASSRHDEEQMFLEARRALNREEFDRASELFQALRSKYHAGRFVPDSYYWEAFGRYRAGDLPEALTLLDLTAVYREAQSNYYDGNMYKTGRLYKDVRDLRLRIQRQQAEKGDSRAAEEVLREAEAVLLADTARLGRTVDRAREARLQRVVKDLQWRADSAMAVQTAWLRADSLARELARRRARSGSATAEANLRRFLEEAERDQSNLEAALTNLLARDWPDSAEAEVGPPEFPGRSGAKARGCPDCLAGYRGGTTRHGCTIASRHGASARGSLHPTPGSRGLPGRFGSTGSPHGVAATRKRPDTIRAQCTRARGRMHGPFAPSGGDLAGSAGYGGG